jgi:hypothetical protein
MPNVVYPLFREYSIAVREWLRQIVSLPRFDRYDEKIMKLIKNGTTGGGVNQSEIHLVDTAHDFKAGHPIKIIGSTQNDEYYVIKTVVGNVLILDIEYRRLIASEDFTAIAANSRPIVKRTINIVYANMDRSVALIAQPLRNGSIDSPGISFNITDVQFSAEKSRPHENYYTRRYKDNNRNITSVAKVPPLLEYQVQYSVNTWAVYQQEMDILQYQLVAEFNPQKFFWIGETGYGANYTGDREDREHKGQWAHAIVSSIADVSELEPGDAQTRSLRTELNFTITNAFLPQPFDIDDQHMIGSIDLETIVE